MKCSLRAIAFIYPLSVTENKPGTIFLKHYCKSLWWVLSSFLHTYRGPPGKGPLQAGLYLKLGVSSANLLFLLCKL